MQQIMDFPPEILSQIFGSEYTSYLVIRIWLCGSTTLNKKLSNGLSFLNLSLHQFATCKYPRLVSEFHNLRHFAIASPSNLVSGLSDWTEVMKSLPNTLISLSISSRDSWATLPDFEDFAESNPTADPAMLTSQQKDELRALNLASLFPRLQTLSITSSSQEMPSHWFTNLPTTLTELTAPIQLVYNHDDESLCNPLAQLPRGLITLNGPINWRLMDRWRRVPPNTMRMLRDDIINAPPHLQSLYIASLSLREPLSDFWLPKSLLTVMMPRNEAFAWTPEIARTMPHNLHTLDINAINTSSYASTFTNWVADLPKTLTNVTIHNNNRPHLPLDFTPFSHCLPPHLTTLSLLGNRSNVSLGTFGDWSCIETSEVENGKHWPKSLTSLKLLHFSIKPSDIARLPKTLLKLDATTCLPFDDDTKLTEINPKHFAPCLTDLTLTCDGPTNLQVSQLHCLAMLKECILNRNEALNAVFASDAPPGSPSITPLSQLLTKLVIPSWNCNYFKDLPRGLRHFETTSLSGHVQSPLLVTNDLFRDLPTCLLYLILRGADSPESFELPPQRLNHLSSLLTIVISGLLVSSSMMKMLPASLRGVHLEFSECIESDLLFCPPRVEIFMSDFSKADMSQVVQNLPIAALTGLLAWGKESVEDLIRQRIEYEVKHP